MSGWIAGSLVVLTIALVAVVASTRLIADMIRDLSLEVARLRSIGVEVTLLSDQLRAAGRRRARGQQPPR